MRMKVRNTGFWIVWVFILLAVMVGVVVLRMDQKPDKLIQNQSRIPAWVWCASRDFNHKTIEMDYANYGEKITFVAGFKKCIAVETKRRNNQVTWYFVRR